MSYITKEQVKLEEKLLDETQFDNRLDSLILKSDKMVESLAETKGVFDPDDISVPVHVEIENYAIYWVIETCLKSLAGPNVNQLREEIDRYWVKYMEWKGKAKDLEKSITKEMFTGVVDEKRDRYTVRTITRGS